MGIDDLERKFEIGDEYIEKLKKGELSIDDFYTVYEILSKEGKREINELRETLDNDKKKIIAFKREYAGLIRRLSEFQSNFISIMEHLNEKYINRDASFEKQIKEYDEMQKQIQDSEKENQ
jgi:hypothetical protein